MRSIIKRCLHFSIPAILIMFPLACGSPQEGGSTAKTQFITIGTGGVTGVYYPVGGHLATLLNENTADHSIQASVESTGGSVYNINAVLSGDLDFGICQADRQYQAYKGLKEWEGTGPQESLRAVFSLYTETITLAGADDAGIKSLDGLKGKSVNIGNPGSGTRENALDVLKAAGLNPDTDLQVQGIKSSESPKLLQDERIDAFFFTCGHPAGVFKQVTTNQRKVWLVPIDGVDALLNEVPYYVKTTIPKAHYPNALNEGDIPSIGMKTTLVTAADTPEETVYQLVKAVVEGFEQVKSGHPALENLSTDDLLEGHTAPLHPGAERYYKEAGLL